MSILQRKLIKHQLLVKLPNICFDSSKVKNYKTNKGVGVIWKFNNALFCSFMIIYSTSSRMLWLHLWPSKILKQNLPKIHFSLIILVQRSKADPTMCKENSYIVIRKLFLRLNWLVPNPLCRIHEALWIKLCSRLRTRPSQWNNNMSIIIAGGILARGFDAFSKIQ